MALFSKRMRRTLIRSTLALLLLAAAGTFLLGHLLTAPVLHTVGPAPADLAASEVEFNGIKGWFVAASPGAPCVVLMHGVRADRRSMIDRARLLRRHGYATLLFDFLATATAEAGALPLAR